MDDWQPYFTNDYNPLKAGSIDGTDIVPHDRGIWRAMNASYKPNLAVRGDPHNTVFVGRLNPETTEESLMQTFSRHGSIKRIRIVRDVVTGFSKCYGFVEFENDKDAQRAAKLMHHETVDSFEILVEMEYSRVLSGWMPRRLGGGLGGKKDSGQLRFGGIDRPFRRMLPSVTLHKDRDNNRYNYNRGLNDRNGSKRHDVRYGDKYDRNDRISSNEHTSKSFRKEHYHTSRANRDRDREKSRLYGSRSGNN